MTRYFNLHSLSLVVVATLINIGCDNNSKPLNPKGTHSADHDHGKEQGHNAGHRHAEEGPHHGHLIELGQEEYHGELTHDDATKTITIYLLDKDAKAPIAVNEPEVVMNLVVAGQPLQIKLAADPQKGDPAGKSSRFSVINEKVLEALESPTTTGRLTVTIGGKIFSGAIEHLEHGDHKH